MSDKSETTGPKALAIVGIWMGGGLMAFHSVDYAAGIAFFAFLATIGVCNLWR